MSEPRFRRGLFLFGLLLLAVWIGISVRNAFANAQLWVDVAETDIVLQGERRIIPDRYRTLALDTESMLAILATAPMEFSEAAANPSEIHLPFPDGSLAHFNFVESPIMEADLGARYPEIRSYIGRGADDPTLFTRFGWTTKGFHAIIFTTGSTVYIDPYSTGDRAHYISYSRDDFSRGLDDEMFEQHEPIVDPAIAAEIEAIVTENPDFVIGEMLRTYRLALATTGEYSIYHSAPNPANKADVLSELNVAMNRVNGVYERDTAVRMVLVADNEDVIFLNPNTDPYTNNNGGTMLGQNQATLDSIIGSANYDIGHVFSTGGGGVAFLGVVCQGGSKARGVTGQTNPVGDPFYIDYVSHEMGHQYGANHTFNGNAGSCSSNRNGSTAYEPGSGTTIMAYAGICGSQDLQPNSDDHFHTHSIQEIVAYTTASTGNVCPVKTNTGNSAPTANSGVGGFTIPINTPFILTGSGTDPNAGDVLTYNWEEYDLGPAGHPNTPSGNAPIFRSFSSVLDPFRYFPRLGDIVNNTQTLGEILPSYSRSLKFRLTVRDNNFAPSAGGVHYSLITINVTSAAGPFLVTNPNTSIVWNSGANVPVAWNVANTTASPVSCTAVDITLSIDGGFTYPVVLADNVPNDGSETVVVPNTPTGQARVRVMCATNVFFDISNANFTITGSGVTPTPTGTATATATASPTPAGPTPTATRLRRTPTPTVTPGGPTLTPTPTSTPRPTRPAN